MRYWIQFLTVIFLITLLAIFIDRYGVTSRSEATERVLRRELSLYKDRTFQLEAELSSLRLRCKPEAGR